MTKENTVIYEKLVHYLKDIGSVVVAFSGGVDSTLLLKVATDVLGDKAVGVLVLSALMPKREIEIAKRSVEDFGLRLKIITLMDDFMADFSHNPPERCYLCKRKVFTLIKQNAESLGIATVVDGSNLDDKGDFRPGMRALQELEIRSPFKELEIGKAEIRSLSKELLLPTWNMPSMACLASRIPYGQELTLEKLEQIDAAEELLKEMGFMQARVRHHGDLARIEVADDQLVAVLECEVRSKLAVKFKELGFRYITLDVLGYRTGSMNETLDEKTKRQSMEG